MHPRGGMRVLLSFMSSRWNGGCRLLMWVVVSYKGGGHENRSFAGGGRGHENRRRKRDSVAAVGSVNLVTMYWCQM